MDVAFNSLKGKEHRFRIVVHPTIGDPMTAEAAIAYALRSLHVGWGERVSKYGKTVYCKVRLSSRPDLLIGADAYLLHSVRENVIGESPPTSPAEAKARQQATKKVHRAKYVSA